MGYNLNNDVALGQLGSAYLNDGDAFTPPPGKVVIAITMVGETAFDQLLPEAITDSTYKAPIDSGNNQGGTGTFGGTVGTPVGELNSFGKQTPTAANGTNADAVAASDQFPAGLTIYGRWKTVELNTTVTPAIDNRVILYFGV
tara:strand:- start:715 stop:1143 length:429 start_codon:yes stop_codon:yes gene_type:complete